MFVTKILKRGEKICVQKQFEYLQKQKLPAMEIYVLQLLYPIRRQRQMCIRDSCRSNNKKARATAILNFLQVQI